MVIQTKYKLGDRVWIVYENRGEVCVYDDYIDEIYVNENGVYYMLKEACIDHTEKDIVLYDDAEKISRENKANYGEHKGKRSYKHMKGVMLWLA